MRLSGPTGSPAFANAALQVETAVTVRVGHVAVAVKETDPAVLRAAKATVFPVASMVLAAAREEGKAALVRAAATIATAAAAAQPLGGH